MKPRTLGILLLFVVSETLVSNEVSPCEFFFFFFFYWIEFEIVGSEMDPTAVGFSLDRWGFD